MKIWQVVAITAVLSSAATTVALPTAVKLENSRVRVSEVVSAPGASRERGVRQHDQVIVFLDDCRYERTDPATGEKTVRQRKAGEVIWHSKGEDAPLLRNVGDRPYRQIVIDLK